VPATSESAEAQAPVNSTQPVVPSPQPAASPLYSDSSQATSGRNAPSQAVPERGAGETAASSSPAIAETAAAPNSGGSETKGSGAATTVSPSGVLSSPTGRPGLVIQNPVPAVSAAAESRRAEEPRREQPGYPPEYTNRPPPGYPPPPGDRRPPPPPDGRRPPPNFRPLYP